MQGKHSAGKGDTYRKLDYNKWSKNYDAIFNKKKQTKKQRKAKKNER